MSAKLLSLFFLLGASIAQASSGIGLPDLIKDPLGSEPPVLLTGPVLPDQAGIICPSSADLNLLLSDKERDRLCSGFGTVWVAMISVIKRTV